MTQKSTLGLSDKEIKRRKYFEQHSEMYKEREGEYRMTNQARELRTTYYYGSKTKEEVINFFALTVLITVNIFYLHRPYD